MSFKYLAFIILLSIYSCSSTEKQGEVDRYSLQLVMPGTQGDYIPVELDLYQSSALLRNGLEEIIIDSVVRSGDSVHFELPVFDSEMHLLVDEEKLSGEWKKYVKTGLDYSLFVRGSRKKKEQIRSGVELVGKWRMIFSPDDEESYPAIGIFELIDGEVHGTILTETGDYRFLNGRSTDSLFELSTFDGAHAFLFKGELSADSLKGVFRSGPRYSCSFRAWKDENAVLTDPKSLTYLKDGFSSLRFAFPDLNGDTLEYNSTNPSERVTIIQILGSWCPNCMDETRFLVELKEKYGADLDVIGLCFEYSRDFDIARKNVQKMAANLGAEYPFLIAGYASKSEAANKLPMLNKVISYPTSIVINKEGEIVDIHTGFSGPGTGELYTEFTTEFTSMIEELLAE